MAFQIFGATSYEVLQNPVWCVFVFIIVIIILTTVKWIAEKVSAEHPAETCLGQEQGFIYLTAETRKGKRISLICVHLQLSIAHLFI